MWVGSMLGMPFCFSREAFPFLSRELLLLWLGGVVEGVCKGRRYLAVFRRLDDSSSLLLSSQIDSLSRPGDHVVQYSQLGALVSRCPPMLTPPKAQNQRLFTVWCSRNRNVGRVVDAWFRCRCLNRRVA